MVVLEQQRGGYTGGEDTRVCAARWKGPCSPALVPLLTFLTPPSALLPALPSAASPLSVRLRKDSLRLRCRLKPPSISALPGDPGIILVWNQEQCQGAPALPEPDPPHLIEQRREGAGALDTHTHTHTLDTHTHSGHTHTHTLWTHTHSGHTHTLDTHTHSGHTHTHTHTPLNLCPRQGLKWDFHSWA
jgi:hypothetical protein